MGVCKKLVETSKVPAQQGEVPYTLLITSGLAIVYWILAQDWAKGQNQAYDQTLLPIGSEPV